MNLLYGRARTRTDEYIFKIKQGGPLNVRFGIQNTEARIVFVDGKFREYSTNIEASKTLHPRNYLRVQAAIEKSVSAIEEIYKYAKETP